MTLIEMIYLIFMKMLLEKHKNLRLSGKSAFYFFIFELRLFT